MVVIIGGCQACVSRCLKTSASPKPLFSSGSGQCSGESDHAKPYLFLAVAILCEVIATSAMRSSHGFTRLVPSIFTVLMYCVSFYALSQTLAVIPTGIAYAIWSGVGIVLISLVGWIVFQQTLDAPALIGMGLICAGVVVINVFSKATAH